MKRHKVIYTITMDLRIAASTPERAIAKVKEMMKGVTGLDRIPAEKLELIRRARIASWCDTKISEATKVTAS